MRFITICLSLLFVTRISAQEAMFERLTVPVTQNNQLIAYPFTGGLNSPQFNVADLNDDGMDDLVIFDRTGDYLMTFLNDWSGGTSAWVFAPEYGRTFPVLKDYMLMRDYNGDGIMDIFCASQNEGPQEMQVFRGYFQDKVLRFEPFFFTYPGCPTCNRRYIYFPDPTPNNPLAYTNLAISTTDMPGVTDVDGDGDLDILAFTAGTSVYMTWMRNRSVELGFGRDSLKFVKEDECWGKFYENGLEECRAKLSDTPDACAPPGLLEIDDREIQAHPGATILPFDHDNDGDMDLLLGNVSFDCLNLLINGGTPQKAWMVAQDTLFPSEDVVVELPSFPAAYHLDINNDGRKDLIVSPNSPSLLEDRQNVWWYENISTDDTMRLELQSKRLFTSNMIDLGTASHPTWGDVNGDGLIDLVVGNYGYFRSSPDPTTPTTYTNARLYLYLNTGTPSAPKFNLVDTDWLGMSQYAINDYDFAPAFGDLDADGDQDLLVGSNIGAVFCFFNNAGANNPMQLVESTNTMWSIIDVGQTSIPFIFDLDGDNLQDLVMSEKSGNINFFKNVGTPQNPIFNMPPTLTNLGGINTQSVPNGLGYSSAQIIPSSSGNLIVTGAQNGKLEAYQLTGATATAFPIISENWGNIDEGNRSTPAFADINNDGLLEMVIGNQRGGLSLFGTVLQDYVPPTDTQEADQLAGVVITPNPASQWIQVSIDKKMAGTLEWRAFDLLGQVMAQGTSAQSICRIDVANWPVGMYIIEVNVGGLRVAKRVLIQH